jgi:hypothetical protein
LCILATDINSRSFLVRKSGGVNKVWEINGRSAVFRLPVNSIEFTLHGEHLMRKLQAGDKA